MNKIFFLLFSIFGFGLINAMNTDSQSTENQAVDILLSLQQDKNISNKSAVPSVATQGPVFKSIRGISKPAINNSKPLKALLIQAPMMQQNTITMNRIETNEPIIILGKVTKHLTRHSKTIGNCKKKDNKIK